MLQQLQQESGVEMDSLVVNVKKFIKDYGKQKGYSYIFGTGEAASILYAEDKYDITKEIIQLLNDKYKAAPKDGTTDVKADAKKEIQALEKMKK
jgi:outer membrane protein